MAKIKFKEVKDKWTYSVYSVKDYGGGWFDVKLFRNGMIWQGYSGTLFDSRDKARDWAKATIEEIKENIK